MSSLVLKFSHSGSASSTNAHSVYPMERWWGLVSMRFGGGVLGYRVSGPNNDTFTKCTLLSLIYYMSFNNNQEYMIIKKDAGVT